MTTTKILIKRKDDKTPAFPELVLGANAQEGTLAGIVILEEGTAQKKTAVTLRIDVPSMSGSFIASITGDMLKAMTAALHGAEQNFAENPIP